MNIEMNDYLKPLRMILDEAEKGINQLDRTIKQSVIASEQQEILLEEKNGAMPDAINKIVRNMMSPLVAKAYAGPVLALSPGAIVIKSLFDGVSKKSKEEKLKQMMQEYYVEVTKCQRKINDLAVVESGKERKDYLHSMDILLTTLQRGMIQDGWI